MPRKKIGQHKDLSVPYKITWLERTVVVDFFGDVTLEEVREQGRKVNADLRLDSTKKRILNCSRVDSLETSAADLKIFAFIDSDVAKSASGIHLAVVGKGGQIEANTADYREAYGSGNGQVKLFNSIGEALAWDPE